MKEENQKNLYVPELEHDSCGTGFIAHLKGEKSHRIVEDAITMLENMEHRGACGCDPDSGDGAGILLQMPHLFFKEECANLGINLPEFGEYGVGMIFFSTDFNIREKCRRLLNKYIKELGFVLLGYREVPVNSVGVGPSALTGEPKIEQVFVKPAQPISDPNALERKLYLLRNYTSHIINKTIGNDDSFYIASFSYKVIIYKGQLRTIQLSSYFKDLSDTRVVSALALIHSRFSTNTFPKWKLAQPFRYIAHNGEINTIRGNINWMKSKEAILQSALFTDEEIQMLMPICNAANSDSANLDNLVELLTLGGRSLPHVMMMLIPEAWQEDKLMAEEKKAFYEYHASMMEPWDGPAAVCFTDGTLVGATLDRNGLRPSRYCLTNDDYLIMASEAGALPVDQSKVVLKGRLQPGKMFVADLTQGRIISDEELKKDLCSKQPYGKWLQENKVSLNELPGPKQLTYQLDHETLVHRQQAFGYTAEDLKVVLQPMAEKAQEPISSMGIDAPLAVLSDQSQHLSNYFKQLFAQVSNPPIDPIRERMVMSLFTTIGPTLNILAETPEHCRQMHLTQPVLTNDDLSKLKYITHPDFKSKTLDAIFPADGKKGSLEKAIDTLCQEAETAVLDGCNILIISDKAFDSKNVPIPSLLATGAIHHHLIRKCLRTKASIVVEAGDVRETHHFATLIGYGASAINPYIAFETISSFKRDNLLTPSITEAQAHYNYIKAIGYGLLKIFSKMGISTLQSYQGAQIFEALGVSTYVIEKCFTGTISRIEGLNFDGIAKESLVKHRLAFPAKPLANPRLEVGGVMQWKRTGEAHLFNP